MPPSLLPPLLLLPPPPSLLPPLLLPPPPPSLLPPLLLLSPPLLPPLRLRLSALPPPMPSPSPPLPQPRLICKLMGVPVCQSCGGGESVSSIDVTLRRSEAGAGDGERGGGEEW